MPVRHEGPKPSDWGLLQLVAIREVQTGALSMATFKALSNRNALTTGAGPLIILLSGEVIHQRSMAAPGSGSRTREMGWHG